LPAAGEAGSRDRDCLAPAGDDRKLYLAKLDWHPSTTDMVNWRYNREDSSDFNSGVGGISTVEHGRSSEKYYWDRGRLDRILNGNTTNELRGVFNRAHPQGNVNAGQTYEILRPSGQLGAPVNYGLMARTGSSSWTTFRSYAGLTRPSSASATAMSATSATSELQGRPVLLHHGSALQPVRPEHASLQFVIVEGARLDERANLFGAFAQDSWRIGSRVVLNYGIRYDSDDSLTISGAKPCEHGLARVGVAWSLDRQSKTVVRASGGFSTTANTPTSPTFSFSITCSWTAP